jgi:hypothetical protein
MIADRWQRLNEVFHSAIALGAEERDAFLANACADDPALRGEVERLIAAHARAGVFIESPALASVAAWAAGTASQRRRADASAPIAWCARSAAAGWAPCSWRSVPTGSSTSGSRSS